jgi:cytochrome b561
MIMGSMMGYVFPIYMMYFTYSAQSYFQEVNITTSEFYQTWFVLGVVIFVVVTLRFYSWFNKLFSKTNVNNKTKKVSLFR